LLSIVAAEDGSVAATWKTLSESQPINSHHSRILADADLITGERQGKWTWWRNVPERLAEMRRLLGGP
jgi:ArsR family transcriptional regulator